MKAKAHTVRSNCLMLIFPLWNVALKFYLYKLYMGKIESQGKAF